eukprot:TRINITY_DN5889_c1_g1_i1.p1 TRINITY_DN5889_c1_g1~~TRINITY_DN5889_c1_g1_i1.p1  ORF type:complete len:398 (+),score=77.07 TRINITY_DN5889_c1_g1_i1:71-1264(+)
MDKGEGAGSQEREKSPIKKRSEPKVNVKEQIKIETKEKEEEKRQEESGVVFRKFDEEKRLVLEYSAEKQTRWSFIQAIFGFGFLTTLFYVLFLILLYCLYQLIWNGSLYHIAVVLILLSTSLYPSQSPWQGFIDLPIWQSLCEYMSFKITIEKKKKIAADGTVSYVDWYRDPTVSNAEADNEKDYNKQFIFVEFPHGVIPFGFVLSTTAVQKIWPGLKLEGAIASALFKLPLVSHLCHWLGTRSASSHTIYDTLNRGHSVGILAGGVAELFLTNREQEKVYFKKRKGIIKIAISKGVPLVPVYYFGQTQLYDFIGFPVLSRKLRGAMCFFYGRWFSPVPIQHPVTMVVGVPMELKQILDPTPEQIDEVHGEFIKRLKQLFDEHKTQFGWADKQLEIV